MGVGCFCSFDAGSHCPPILRMPHLAFPLNEMAEGLGRVGQTKIQLVDQPEYLAPVASGPSVEGADWERAFPCFLPLLPDAGLGVLLKFFLKACD